MLLSRLHILPLDIDLPNIYGDLVNLSLFSSFFPVILLLYTVFIAEECDRYPHYGTLPSSKYWAIATNLPSRSIAVGIKITLHTSYLFLNIDLPHIHGDLINLLHFSKPLRDSLDMSQRCLTLRRDCCSRE